MRVAMEDGRRGRGALTPNNRHMKPALLFVIGASGAGKTAAVQALDARALPGVQCHYLDSIDVPSSELRWRVPACATRASCSSIATLVSARRASPGRAASQSW